MKLYDILEPSNKHYQEPGNDDEILALGIDLGTTNSLIAYSIKGKVTIIPNKDNQTIIPSIVHYLHDEIIKVGNYSNNINDKNNIIIRSIKRLMGKSSQDLLDEKHILFKHLSASIKQLINNDNERYIELKISDNKSVNPIDVSAEILKYLASIASQNLNKQITNIVITVPAYFDDAARYATKLAAKKAGLNVLRLINEPTAAALAYGLHKKVEGTYLVYDLGGGTFDVSILQMQQGIFKVIATAGDNILGGDDFDYLLANYLRTKITLPEEELILLAKKIKEALSSQDQYELEINQDKLIISKNEFLEIIHDLVERTIKITKKAIMDANLEYANLDGIILVGGSTRISYIKELLARTFQCPILDDINPDEIVVMGAAIQAENLTKSSNQLLLDINPLSLGLETMGGVVEKIIFRNTQIPISRSQEFTTHQDGQTGMKFHIVQGEREFAKDCRSLARFELKNIPAMPAGMARVLVTFTIDADGLLTVEAEELISKVRQEIEVKPSYGLNEEEIKNMLFDAIYNGEQDILNRVNQETLLEAENTVKKIDDIFFRDKSLINQEEYIKIFAASQDLKQALSSSNIDLINQKLFELNTEVRSLTEKINI